MNFIDYGYNSSRASDTLKAIYDKKSVKRICWIGFIVLLGIPLLYMLFAIVFNWDSLFHVLNGFNNSIPESMWVDGKVSFKLWGITTLVLLFSATFIFLILYSISCILVLFLLEAKQLVYLVLHVSAVVTALIFTELLVQYDSELANLDFWSKVGLMFGIWAGFQFFLRWFVIPFIRGCFEQNKSKICFAITIIGVASVFFANRVFDFSSIAEELELTSKVISPIVLQSIIAILLLVLMSYINAWIRLPDQMGDIHKFAAYSFLIILTLGIALAAGATSSSSRAKYRDSDGNLYDENKKPLP